MGKLLRPKISKKLIGLGDSHLDNFTFFCAATCRVPGATAYGLTNPNSDTRAREAFLGFLSSFPNYIPLLCIGEVDCNSLPWRVESSISPEDVIHCSIDRLFRFLKETKIHFILPSVTLPPVDLYSDINSRLHVSAGKQERTILVNLYNNLLKENISKTNHTYLDLTTPTTGPDGLVDKHFIRSTSDVHLASDKVYPIVRDLLDSVNL